MRVEQSGEVHWICHAKVKARGDRTTQAVPSLPKLRNDDDDESPRSEVTSTLMVVQGSGNDPDAAIRDATERVLLCSLRGTQK